MFVLSVLPSVYFLKTYTVLRELHCLHKLLLVRIAESFEVCNYLSIKFAVLRRQRKRKSVACHRHPTELGFLGKDTQL